ncbi:hypothetical protein GCM10022286_09190 [Gryllotalpicola daejeonensis]|uniref:Peptidase A4 family protein n=1 Tax=Gryllotalpicola daejeonensis TaxID=993087 RepID=A0ABP7ZIN8_9MICO
MSFASRWAAGAAVALVAAGALAAAAPAGAAPAHSAQTAQTASAVHAVSGQHRFFPGPGGRGHRLPTTTGSTSGAQSSYNWAGYAKTGTFSSASATWTVPTTLSTKSGYASTWVGLDGYADSYLTQTGIEEDVVNGRVTYGAWWEVITPTNVAPEVAFSGFTIKPGDSITGTATRNGSTTTLTLKDNTTGKTASHTASFAGPGASAEWIQEDVDVNGYISTAPDWQKVTFTGVKTNGVSAGLTSSQSIDIVDTQGTRETSTSAPNSTKDGFTVTWLATGTRTRAD